MYKRKDDIHRRKAMEEQKKGQSKSGKGIKEAIRQGMKDAGAVLI